MNYNDLNRLNQRVNDLEKQDTRRRMGISSNRAQNMTNSMSSQLPMYPTSDMPTLSSSLSTGYTDIEYAKKQMNNSRRRSSSNNYMK